MQSQPLPKPLLKAHHKPIFNYLIIDCAHLEEEFYQTTLNNPNLQAQSLFMQTADEPSASAGPLLVKLNLEKNTRFIETIQQIEQQIPAIIWLWSDQSFKRLANNILKPLQYGELKDGNQVLIRYYDPRCFEGVLKVFKANISAARKLKNIQAWAFKQDNQYLYFS